jgi:nucleoside-diphosphate-sugar epimerase
VNRVLVTGGAGFLGAAVVRRLLSDPDYEVRVADLLPAPDWMRESCPVRAADLRDVREASDAMRGCTHVVHLAALTDDAHPYTLAEHNHALHNAVLHAALDAGLERLVHVSCAEVLERAQRFPTPEEDVLDCPPPRSPRAWSMLTGERQCRAAQAEHGLPVTICRPCDAYGPGRPLERLVSGAPSDTRTPTHVTDVADGIVVAMSHPAGLGEDFNLAAAEELPVAEIARLAGVAAPAGDREARRRWPAAEKARRLLGWSARIAVRDG